MGGCGALMRGMANTFAAVGFPVVTFDMRGAGQSSGAATLTGQHEVKDVEAVCRFVNQTLQHSVILVGSSAGAPCDISAPAKENGDTNSDGWNAGAPIAGSALPALPQIRAYIGVGYVFGWWASILFGRHYKAVLDSDLPKLFIMGDKDGFTSVNQLTKRVASCKGLASMKIVPNVGHFELETEKYDQDVVDLIQSWLADNESSICGP
jgi:uncharacterized protein